MSSSVIHPVHTLKSLLSYMEIGHAYLGRLIIDGLPCNDKFLREKPLVFMIHFK